jgi:hypothetical protein
LKALVRIVLETQDALKKNEEALRLRAERPASTDRGWGHKLCPEAQRASTYIRASDSSIFWPQLQEQDIDLAK